jgi:hypothetical protein
MVEMTVAGLQSDPPRPPRRDGLAFGANCPRHALEGNIHDRDCEGRRHRQLGTMGNGIAQTCAMAGSMSQWSTSPMLPCSGGLAYPSPPASSARQKEKAIPRFQVASAGANHRRRPNTRHSSPPIWSSKAATENLGAQAQDSSPSRLASLDPDVLLATTHVVDLDHGARRRDIAAHASWWHAFFQSGSR